MSTVAEQLHLAREAKSLTVHQVAEVTKIRTDHIRALEEGNFNTFSAPVYIKGFVRTYATLLKLDVPRVMASLDEELGQTKKFREPPPLSDEPSKALDFVTLQLSKLNWRKASVILGAIAALIILIVAGIAWRTVERTIRWPTLPPAPTNRRNQAKRCRCRRLQIITNNRRGRLKISAAAVWISGRRKELEADRNHRSMTVAIPRRCHDKITNPANKAAGCATGKACRK